jgi:RNA polymerase sigma-70 factor (ECF subfamily)
VAQVLQRDFPATLAEAQAGSDSALSSLYCELQPEVLAYLRQRAPRDADDLCSEVWLDVHRGLGRFSGDEAGFRGWVFTIARRRLIDDRRRAQRRPTSPLTDPDRLAGDYDPEAEAVGAVTASEVRELVERLPAEQAAVVRLRLVDGLSVDETAARLGKRPGTVRVLHHRGLRRLARLVGLTVATILLTAALAAADVLPEPIQRAAHDTLKRVGIEVPDGTDAPVDDGTGGPVPPADRATSPSQGRSLSPQQQARDETLPADQTVPADATVPPTDAATPVAPPDRPGHQGQDAPPDSPPGSDHDPHGQSGFAPPGQSDTPPLPPGLDRLPPGQGGTPPGQAKKQ